MRQPWSVFLKIVGGLLAAFLVIGSLRLCAGATNNLLDRPVQRGIDAHTVQLTATYEEYIRGRGKLAQDKYVVSYVHEGLRYRINLLDLHGDYQIGDRVCLEIDATQPEHGRICGTRGDYDGALTDFAWGFGLLALLGLVVVIALFVAVKIDPLSRMMRPNPQRVPRSKHWVARLPGNVAANLPAKRPARRRQRRRDNDRR
jgi:hypothetical protein